MKRFVRASLAAVFLTACGVDSSATRQSEDSGARDAGRAGTSDGGGAQPDAGATPDAGGADSGARDSGTVDSGTRDAGTVDGGTVHDSGPPDPCAHHDCGPHATCSVHKRRAVCSCDTGYQDNDADGVCAEDCDEQRCTGHGQCSAASGSTVCSCGAGWSGASCAAADCASMGCANGASCSTASGAAVCSCASGWSGPTCTTADCSHVTCPSHATCSTGTGRAVCACDPGFAGDNCDFTILYGLDVPTNADWSPGARVPYDIDRSRDHGLFDRVGYRFELDGSYVWVEAAAFTQERTQLGVPSTFRWDRSLADVTVRTNSPAVSAVSHSPNGKLEFWSDCYTEGADGVFNNDDDDDLSRPGCYGSMQLFDGTATLFALNHWTGGNRLDVGIGNGNLNPDWTAAANAGDYRHRRLEVYVHRFADCSFDPCAFGTCGPLSQPIVCACNPGYRGVVCDQCELGYDRQNDGSCVSACGAAACDGLTKTRGLATGLHDMQLAGAGRVSVYIDGDYNFGGWLLVGRGRENWDWDDNGRGTPAEVAANIATSAAFDPKYLSSAVIAQLTRSAPGNLDLRQLDMLVKRAANTTGTAYQYTRIRFTNTTSFSWDFPSVEPNVDVIVDSSALGPGGTSSGDLIDVQSGGDDQRRIFTFAWDDHNDEQGFSYGATVNLGDNSSTNYLWEYQGESSAIPYTEVYLRVAPCFPFTCGTHGSCDDSGGPPVCTCTTGYSGTHCDFCAASYQDNDDDGRCLPACTAASCTNPGEVCTDLSGAIQCLSVNGASCLDIQQRDPDAASGSYVIDPDGSGGGDPIGVLCDMTTAGGGWTVIEKESFENGIAPAWSDPRVDTTSDCVAVYSRTLGGFNLFGVGADTHRTYDLLGIPHNEVYVALDYISIDSWDFEHGIVRVDGITVFDEPLYAGDGSELCGDSTWSDRDSTRVVSRTPNLNDSLTLELTSTLDQMPDDESFAADNVVVMVR